PSQDQKPPELLVVEGRNNKGTFQVRVRHGAWTTAVAEIVKQVQAQGATAETTIQLNLEASVEFKWAKELMDSLAKLNFKKIEFASPLVPFDDAPTPKPATPPPGIPKRAPRPPPPPLTIEVLHPAKDCPLVGAGRVCPSALHWSFRLGPEECSGSNALRAALREQIPPDPDPLGPGPQRAVLVQTAVGAPYGLIMELLVAVTEISNSTFTFQEPRDPAAPP